MITFETGIDYRCRTDKPQVARFNVAPGDYRYICIGTDYGYVHTTSGSVRTWRTASGARRFLTKYLADRSITE